MRAHDNCHPGAAGRQPPRPPFLAALASCLRTVVSNGRLAYYPRGMPFLSRRNDVNTFDQFESYAAVADQLIAELSKTQLAECARMLALHVADYRRQFGEIPHTDLLRLADTIKIGAEQAALLRDGMEILVGSLENVRERTDLGPSE